MRRTLKQLFILTILLALATPFVTHALSLSYIIFSIAGVFLGMGAGILDVAMNEFVLEMGSKLQSGTAFGEGVETVWKIVRDLVNLTFIFGLLYIGILTIVGKAGGNTKRLVASIVIGALLVNFSLFIARGITDVANIASVEIYQTLGLQNQGGAQGAAVLQGVTLSEAVMSRAGLYDLASNGYDPNTVQNLSGDEYIAFVVGGSAFLIVTTFVFAAAGILLIIRFAVLMILMALSPIAFIPRDIPVVGGWSGKWWRKFIDQALFAPAFLFMMYVTLLLTSGAAFSNQTGNFANIFRQGQFASGYQAMLFFLLLIVGMIISIIIAKQMGAYGASTALKWGNNLQRSARRSAQGWAGRNTIGRSAQLLRRGYEQLDARYANSKFAQNKYGRIAGRALRSTLNTATLGATSDRTVRQTLKNVENSKYGGYRSLADDEKYDKEVARTQSKISRGNKQRGAINALANNTWSNEAERKNHLDAVTNMNAAELEDLGADKLAKIAPHLTNKQMDQIRDSKEGFTEIEKGKIKAARKEAQVSEYNADPAAYLSKLKASDTAKLPKDIILDRNAVNHLSGEVLRRLHDDDALLPDERKSLAANILISGTSQKSAQEYIKSPRGQNYYSI